MNISTLSSVNQSVQLTPQQQERLAYLARQERRKVIRDLALALVIGGLTILSGQGQAAFLILLALIGIHGKAFWDVQQALLNPTPTYVRGKVKQKISGTPRNAHKRVGIRKVAQSRNKGSNYLNLYFLDEEDFSGLTKAGVYEFYYVRKWLVSAVPVTETLVAVAEPVNREVPLLQTLNNTVDELALNRKGELSSAQHELVQSAFQRYRREIWRSISLRLGIAVLVIMGAGFIGDRYIWGLGISVTLILVMLAMHLIQRLKDTQHAINTPTLHVGQGYLRVYYASFGRAWVILNGKKLDFANAKAYAHFKKMQMYQVYVVGHWIIAIEPVQA
jgi:hypothetical protein